MSLTPPSFDTVGVGSNPNDGTGDSLRDAFITINENFANIETVGFNSSDINCTGSIEVNGYASINGNLIANNAYINGNLIVNNAYTPSANNSLGTAGQISWSSGNVYICVAANTWVRASLTSSF